MHAKSSTRLRLECLETRSLLSAIGLPLLPTVALPSAPAAAGEFHRSGNHPLLPAVVQETVEIAGLSPIADPAKWPDAATISHSVLQVAIIAEAVETAALPPIADPVNWPNAATGSDALDAGSAAPDLQMPRHDWLPARGAAEPAPVALHAPPQLGSPLGLADNAPAMLDPAGLPQVAVEADLTIEVVPGNRASAGFRLPSGRDADEAVETTVENAVPTDAAPSAPPVNPHVPDMPASLDANRVGDPSAMAALATPLPASTGMANLPATTTVLADAAASNSVEGGFISLDETSAAAPRLGGAPLPDMVFKGVEGTAPDQGTWLTDILSSPRSPADYGSNPPRSGASLASGLASPPQVLVAPDVNAEEGGSIELAIALPSPAAPGGDALAAEAPSAGNPPQRLSDIRPQSGVALFCDIEVSVASPLPPMGSAAAMSSPNAGSLARAPAPKSNAKAVAELGPPPARLLQSTTPGLANDLPLLLGVTVLVSAGGLRLEETLPPRERHLQSIQDLRRLRDR